jgi:hypothetical protein
MDEPDVVPTDQLRWQCGHWQMPLACASRCATFPLVQVSGKFILKQLLTESPAIGACQDLYPGVRDITAKSPACGSSL